MRKMYILEIYDSIDENSTQTFLETKVLETRHWYYYSKDQRIATYKCVQTLRAKS